MNNLRHERVRELLKREIGEAVRREFHVNECGLISVNDVDVSGDLKSAVVFISIFGNADQQKRGIQALNEHRIRIQGLVGKSVVLKFTPTLKFVFISIFGNADQQKRGIQALNEHRIRIQGL